MIMSYRAQSPMIDNSCFVADNATIIGDVNLHKNVSVWFGAVIRGDKDHIEIGDNSNIQDNCTLHTDPHHVLTIGNDVTIGHNAILHGCRIADEVLIGMGAIVLNGASIGTHCIIGAGALVTEHMQIPDNSIDVGCPAKIIKTVSEEQIKEIQENAAHYAKLGNEYKER